MLIVKVVISREGSWGSNPPIICISNLKHIFNYEKNQTMVVLIENILHYSSMEEIAILNNFEYIMYYWPQL